MRRLFGCMALVPLFGCGGSTPAVDPPTAATPAPTPTPSAAPVNPFAAACGQPLPSFNDSYGFGIKVQLEPTRNRKVLNASPQVRNEAYCAAVGIGGRSCNTRFEDNPQRVPCDHYMSGMSETNRPGPNWYKEVNGRRLRCGGMGVTAETSDCKLKDSNQYLLDVTEPGKYVACGGTNSPGTCGHCILDDEDFGVIHASPAGLCRIEGSLTF
jgi:hypothetical protein